MIETLVDLLFNSGAITDREKVIESVIDREKQVGTGVGFGVAIPHAEPGLFSEPLAAFGRLVKPVDFHAPDGKKVNLVFLLLTPEKTPALHVRLLARICRLTRSQYLRNRLLRVATPKEAAKIIAEMETDYPELIP